MRSKKPKKHVDARGRSSVTTSPTGLGDRGHLNLSPKQVHAVVDTQRTAPKTAALIGVISDGLSKSRKDASPANVALSGQLDHDAAPLPSSWLTFGVSGTF